MLLLLVLVLLPHALDEEFSGASGWREGCEGPQASGLRSARLADWSSEFWRPQRGARARTRTRTGIGARSNLRCGCGAPGRRTSTFVSMQTSALPDIWLRGVAIGRSGS